MPTNNDILARRADLVTADLNASGELTTTQGSRFVRMIQNAPTLLNQVRVVDMPGPTYEINRIGIGSRILRAAPQGSSPYQDDDGLTNRKLAAASRVKPTTAKVKLTSKEVMAVLLLPYTALEDNIEGTAMEDTVMQLMANQAAVDLEEWLLWADTASGDAYLALTDGVFKRCTSHVVDNLSAGISPTMFEAGMLAMPEKYLRDPSQLAHWTSVAEEIRYRGVVAQRATGYGDAALTSNIPLYAGGVPVKRSAGFGMYSSGKKGLFTHPQNLILGVQRRISVEAERMIEDRLVKIVMTLRADIQVEDTNAVVVYENI